MALLSTGLHSRGGFGWKCHSPTQTILKQDERGRHEFDFRYMKCGVLVGY